MNVDDATPDGTGPDRAQAGTGAAAPSALDLVVAAARAADTKAGRDTIVLEVGEVLGITTWFVITSAGNARAVRAIVDNVEEQIDLLGGPKPTMVEGRDSMQWVLMSYPDFVVHVFDQETRDYYELERLWRDVPSVDWADATDGSSGS